MKIKFSLFISFFCLISTSMIAQETNVFIAHKQSKAPIAYAQFFLKDEIIGFSNSKGILKLRTDKINNLDSIKITAIGYKTSFIPFEELKHKDSIFIDKEIQTLESVFIIDKALTAREIIEKAKKNILENYKLDSLNFKIHKTETRTYEFEQFDIKAKKLTLILEKDNRKQFEERLEKYVDSINNNIHLSRKSYTFLFKQLPYDRPKVKKIGETDIFMTHLDPIRVSSMNYTLEKVLIPYINTDLSYKIKSGAIPFEQSYKVNSYDNRNNNKKYINKDWYQKNVLNPLEYDFLKNSDDYDFYIEKTVQLDDNLYYHLSFSPERNHKKMEGQVFVSVEDFGLLKGNFQLVDGKNLENINLKLVLGAAIKKNKHEVTFGYTHKTNGKYIPKYFSIKNGEYNYFHRDYRMKFVNDKWLKANDKVTTTLLLEGQGLELTEITFEENHENFTKKY